MADIAKELLVLVPGAFVVIVTVLIFLKHTTTQNDRWISAHKETSKRMNDAADTCSGVVAKNTEMLGRIDSTLTRIEKNGGPGGN